MRDEHQQDIGRIIAHLRERQGWSQRQLAKVVGVDQSALSRVEAGRRRVSAQELLRFADAFHVSADALLAGLPDDSPATPTPQLSHRLRSGPVARVAHSTVAPPAQDALERRLFDEDVACEDGVAGAPEPHPDIAAADYADDDVSYPARSAAAPRRQISGVSPGPAPRGHALQLRADSRDAQTIPDLHAPSSALPRLDGLPAEVAAVARDWFELRRLAGGDEPALAWSSGHSAEGKPARFAHPVQPAERGSLGGDVLYDRVARFWRSELHVEPDDGPLPDLVPLLEDGLGAQVIVARVAGGEAAPAGAGSTAADRPVCACLNAGGMPFLFVNAARPVVLQRFALAHALAHLVLGHGDVVDASIEWSRNNPREAAANDFTEEFLAPVRAVDRWYERRGEPRPEVETLLELGNAFGISAWAALYRSRAARRLHAKQFSLLNHELRRLEWELLPRQAFLGGLRDTLTHLTPAESLPPGQYGRPAVLRVPASMRAWAFAAVRGGRLSLERAAACLQTDARELATQLARLGLE